MGWLHRQDIPGPKSEVNNNLWKVNITPASQIFDKLVTHCTEEIARYSQVV